MVLREPLNQGHLGVHAHAVFCQLFGGEDGQVGVGVAGVLNGQNAVHNVLVAVNGVVHIGCRHPDFGVHQALEDVEGFGGHGGADGHCRGKQPAAYRQGTQGAAAAHGHPGDVHAAGIHLALCNHLADQVAHPSQVGAVPTGVGVLDRTGKGLGAGQADGEFPRRGLGGHDVHFRIELCQADGAHSAHHLHKVVAAALTAAVEEQDQGTGPAGFGGVQAVVDAVFLQRGKLVHALHFHVGNVLFGQGNPLCGAAAGEGELLVVGKLLRYHADASGDGLHSGDGFFRLLATLVHRQGKVCRGSVLRAAHQVKILGDPANVFHLCIHSHLHGIQLLSFLPKFFQTTPQL